jgi:hypothetical protein
MAGNIVPNWHSFKKLMSYLRASVGCPRVINILVYTYEGKIRLKITKNISNCDSNSIHINIGQSCSLSVGWLVCLQQVSTIVKM